MNLAHSIDEALDRFELIAGPGSESTGKGCATTVLAWMAGEAWSDALPCANQVLRRYVITANDTTSPTQRALILRAGEHGLLDTWWVPDQVVAWCLAGAKDASFVERVIAALHGVAQWKETHKVPNLGGADLGGANLRGANLRGADLRGANLGDANLGDANLRDADLRDANLRGADLGDANLRDADLRGANLRGADLGDANLGDANLGDANLGGANLRGANLRGADLGDANLGGANLGDADLGDANLRGANLRDADLGGANLGGANLGGAKANKWTSWPDGYEPQGVVSL